MERRLEDVDVTVFDELSEEERELLRIMRSRRMPDERLPQTTPEELKRLLRARVGIGGEGGQTVVKTLGYLQRATGTPLLPEAATGRELDPYPGPKIILTGTLAELRASWRQMHDDMVARGSSGAAIRNYRTALHRYCRALELPWRPDRSAFERRSIRARKRRAEMIQLPEDFIARCASVVNSIVYAKDEALNACYQHRIRFGLFTAPREPSEGSRFRLQDIAIASGKITYWQSKVGADDGELVLIPREVFGLRPTVLTHPRRKSLDAWITKGRPRLFARAETRWGTARAADLARDRVWLNANGTAMNGNIFRTVSSAAAKEAWPDWHPYKVREIGLIMHALEVWLETGHFDLELMIQWSGHEELDTLRGYLKAARKLFRDAGEDPKAVAALLEEWRRI